MNIDERNKEKSALGRKNILKVDRVGIFQDVRYEKVCYCCATVYYSNRANSLTCCKACSMTVRRWRLNGVKLDLPKPNPKLRAAYGLVDKGPEDQKETEVPPVRKMAMVARIVKMGDDDAETEYWANRSHAERLEHLEELRKSYDVQAMSTTIEGINMEFDENGYLKSKGPIEADLETIKAVFVDGLSPVRAELWGNFEDYLRRFSRSFTPYVEIWLDGSFVSRKAQPKDIDFVVFLNWKLYEWGDSSGNLEKFWSFSLEKEKLDAYIVPVYPDGHEKFTLTQEMKEKWMEIYGQKPVNGLIHQKGFIKLYPAK